LSSTEIFLKALQSFQKYFGVLSKRNALYCAFVELTLNLDGRGRKFRKISKTTY